MGTHHRDARPGVTAHAGNFRHPSTPDGVEETAGSSETSLSLSPEDVEAIRRDYSDGATQAQLAEQHGVSTSTISAAVHGTGAYAD